VFLKLRVGYLPPYPTRIRKEPVTCIKLNELELFCSFPSAVSYAKLYTVLSVIVVSMYHVYMLNCLLLEGIP
jgi:hypothetical protein